MRIILLLSVVLMQLVADGAFAQSQFDHQHQVWSALLKKHIVLISDGKASQVRYAGMQKDHAQLKIYLESLAKVNKQEFKSWAKAQQLAFLINGYNAHMIEKILTRYPDIKSVWDFGKIFGNPFKDRFFTLLGREFSLDMIEHDTIRAQGVYDDSRIHFAVNCASVGCPMLREEAYVAERLDSQLEEQTRRFLADRTRNRFDATGNALEVSEIFKWYGIDFTSGLKGVRSREQFFARYAELLTNASADRQMIREQKAKLRFLDYDWSLNDAK